MTATTTEKPTAAELEKAPGPKLTPLDDLVIEKLAQAHTENLSPEDCEERAASIIAAIRDSWKIKSSLNAESVMSKNVLVIGFQVARAWYLVARALRNKDDVETPEVDSRGVPLSKTYCGYCKSRMAADNECDCAAYTDDGVDSEAEDNPYLRLYE